MKRSTQKRVRARLVVAGLGLLFAGCAPAPVATLALINQVEENTPLEPGRLVKWVVGQQLPVTP